MGTREEKKCEVEYKWAERRGVDGKREAKWDLVRLYFVYFSEEYNKHKLIHVHLVYCCYTFKFSLA